MLVLAAGTRPFCSAAPLAAWAAGSVGASTSTGDPARRVTFTPMRKLPADRLPYAIGHQAAEAASLHRGVAMLIDEA
jgi:hypothetical protein